jgi:ATP-dependent Clp protease ATP-binding subunit ClpB
VVLFDEIEKAHPDVFNVLLQLLDDGRLTDGQGRVVDFKNAVVIMTSNLGSELILEAKDMAQVRRGIDGLLRASFKPEFINRIDETVVFERLGKDRILAIVDLQLALLARRMAGRKIELEVAKEAKALLADSGYDPLFGARPLKRSIQALVQNPLASEILAGRIRDGQKVRVLVRGGQLAFEASGPA